MSSELAQDLMTRALTMDEAPAVTDLINRCAIAEWGETDITLGEVRNEWRNRDLATDTWGLFEPRGLLVGYGEVDDRQPTRPTAWASVHPDYQGRGIGRYLLERIQERACQGVIKAPPEARVTLGNWIAGVNRPAHDLLEGQGYHLARTFWRMRIVMDAPPSAPEFPAGMTLRAMAPGQDDRAVFEASDEAFQDHWGHLPGNFEEWRKRRIETESFDPSLWLLAVDGDQIAGFSLCGFEDEAAWIHALGVRRPWRRRGLGMALLRASFDLFYRRGARTVELGVDASSLTGATELYKQGGMSVSRQFDRYEKELRPGKELSTQDLA